MASRGPGGRLAEVLLIAALVVVALLTHPASSGWLFSPAPKPIVYPTRCGAKYTANWTNIIRIAAYGGGGGVYAPPVAEGEGGEAAPGAGVFHNSFIGSTSNPGTNVDYLVEAHPTYLNIGKENLESNYAVVGGDNSSAVNRYLDQVVTLEYLDNTKTIYITIYHLVKPSKADEVFKYTHSVYFHRFYCDEKTKPTAENVYNELFPTIDKHLWRDRCKKGGKITGGDLYEPNRKKFIEKVVSDACSVDEKTSKVKPLFDCVKALNVIPPLPGISYSEMLAKYIPDAPTDHDPYINTCPHLSIYAEGKKGGKDEGHIQFIEYYLDPVHPMIMHSVVVHVLVVESMALSSYGYYPEIISPPDAANIYQHIVVPENVYPFGGSKGGVMMPDDCNTRPVLEMMHKLDEAHKAPVKYKFLGKKVGGHPDENDQLIHHGAQVYNSGREHFISELIKACAEGKFFDFAYQKQENYLTSDIDADGGKPV